MNDEQYMQMAIDIAERGCGFVNPNPMVGAVIVKDGEVVSTGFHERFGGPHAEAAAIGRCSAAQLSGARLYVNLEPCCHHGKTPPCTDAIIQSGIKTVVIGTPDPNPLVAGGGARALARAGIEVVTGVLKRECEALNRVFFHFIRTNTPYVVMKYAMTLDGKIASATGKSKWISGEAARRSAHEDRRRYSAVMVGLGTVLADDPLLTCRAQYGRNPMRIVCDARLQTPLGSQIVATAGTVPTIFAAGAEADAEARRALIEAGCDIITVPTEGGGGFVDLRGLMDELGKRGIDSVLLEGGGALNWSALQSGVVNRVKAYVAPKLMGGRKAVSPVAGDGVCTPDAAFALTNTTVSMLDGDILIESDVESGCLRG